MTQRVQHGLHDNRWWRSILLLAGLTLGASCAPGGDTGVNHTSMSASGLSSGPIQHTSTQVHFEIRRIGQLPQAAMGLGLASNGNGRVYGVGGFTGSEFLSTVTQVYPTVQIATHLPMPTHDAATGFLQGNLYIIGGGENLSTDHIVRVEGFSAKQSHQVPTGVIMERLTAPLSDGTAVVAQRGGQAGLVLVGGYDDRNYRQSVDWVTANSSGSLRFTSVAKLPVGLRYAAAATDGVHVYVVGGRSPAGDTNQVYRIDLTDGRISDVGPLPYPVEKAAAAWLGGKLLVIGGLVKGRASRQMLWVDPATAHVRRAGEFPVAVADMGYTQVGNSVILAGGENERGQAMRDVWILKLG